MAGGRGDDLARAQHTKRSATQWSAAPCASSGPVRQAGPSVAYSRRTSGPAIPCHGKGRLREERRRSRPARVARGMDARQGRDAGSNCIPRRLDAKHDSPAPHSGDAPCISEAMPDSDLVAGGSRASGHGRRRGDRIRCRAVVVEPRVGRVKRGAGYDPMSGFSASARPCGPFTHRQTIGVASTMGTGIEDERRQGLRSIEDLELATQTYAEVKALAAGNSMVIENAGAGADIERYSSSLRLVGTAAGNVARSPCRCWSDDRPCLTRCDGADLMGSTVAKRLPSTAKFSRRDG